MAGLYFRERPAATPQADGLLILHHGRGTHELDLLGLGDALDPEGRLRIVTPRAPFQYPGAPGYHWYSVPRVGYPDPETFFTSRDLLAELHDELIESTGVDPERTVLGGFSQGTVMSFALGLDLARPAPGGILAFSGFIPEVPGWEPDVAGRAAFTRVFITHGRADPVIGVDFARRARETLLGGGLTPEYLETGASHTIPPESLRAAQAWLRDTVAP